MEDKDMSSRNTEIKRVRKHKHREGLPVPRPGTIGNGSVDRQVAEAIEAVNAKFETSYRTPHDVMTGVYANHKKLYQRLAGIG